MKNSPKPPSHLSREAKTWWKKIVGGWEMDDPGLMILENALEAFDRMRQAQKVLKEEGVTIKDRFDVTKAHPAVIVERDCKTTLLRFLKALGLDMEPVHDRPGRPPGR